MSKIRMAVVYQENAGEPGFRERVEAHQDRDRFPPIWGRLWGEDYHLWSDLLNHVFFNARDLPREEREKLITITRDKIIPVLGRCEDVQDDEREDLFAVYRKYRAPEIGELDKALKAHTSMMKEMESDPHLSPILKGKRAYSHPIHDAVVVDTLLGGGSLTIDAYLRPRKHKMEDKEFRLRSLTSQNGAKRNKIALMEKEIHALTSALDSHGIELPVEFLDIRERRVELFGLEGIVQEEPTKLENSAPNTGEDRQTSPEVNRNSILEGRPGDASPTGDAISTTHSKTTEPDSHHDPSNKAIRSHHMDNAELLDLLNYLRKHKYGKLFDKPITNDECSGYFLVVKEHRDLTTIQASLLNEEPHPQGYDAINFFNDMRLMLDNYSCFFGANSYEFDMACKLENALMERLDRYGEAGQSAKDLFQKAPGAQFIGVDADTAADAPTEQSFEQSGDVNSLPGSTGTSQHTRSETEAADSDREDLDQLEPVAATHAEPMSLEPASVPQELLDQTESGPFESTRATKDQEAAADEVTPPSNRLKTSLNKRPRDADNDEDEGGRPSKRKRAASYPVYKPSETVAPAAGVAGARIEPLPAYKGLSAKRAREDDVDEEESGRQSKRQRAASFPVHIENRSVSPEAQPADSHSHAEGSGSSPVSAAAESAQPELAVDNLGLTNNGAITVAKLQRRRKWKMADGRRQPNRPWVFGYQLANEYALYIVSCPNARCGSPESFTKHPITHDEAAEHLRDCGQNFADDDDMVRQFGTQVIGDTTKAVSIEWARKWNTDLMNEYHTQGFASENF